MTDKPNLVFMMPDQLRHDFLSCYGASFVDTPNIDALCAQGVRYENAYSEHPVCVPARASLLTGMNAIKNGVLENAQFIRPDHAACGIRTWPELLGEAGYRTVATGKMHFYPWEKRFGFDERIIAEDKLWGYIEDDYHHFLDKAGYSKRSFADVPEYHQHHQACVSPLPYAFGVDYFTGVESARWIDEYEGDEPFAMMVGFPGPHSPYDPAPEYADYDRASMPDPLDRVEADAEMMGWVAQRKARTGGRSWYAVLNDEPPTHETYMVQRAYYTGLVKQIDIEVGRIVAALEARGVLDNTIIIFSSDHGDYLGDHGLSGKASFYEGACHVPMLVRHPDVKGGQVSSDLVTLTDVTATLLQAGCGDVPDYVDACPLPGIGLGDASREMIFGALRGSWMAFDGRWKLAKYEGGSQLFDLAEDPGEQNNRARDPDCADVFNRLDTALTREVMRSVRESTYAGRLPRTGNSSSISFGRPGWERTYPMTWNR